MSAPNKSLRFPSVRRESKPANLLLQNVVSKTFRGLVNNKEVWSVLATQNLITLGPDTNEWIHKWHFQLRFAALLHGSFDKSQGICPQSPLYAIFTFHSPGREFREHREHRHEIIFQCLALLGALHEELQCKFSLWSAGMIINRRTMSH